jgi:transcriptional regulator with XRE-family HTH domain
MTDRREQLLKASTSLREIAMSLQALTDPSDHILPVGLRSLLNAIDEIDFVSHLASEASGDRLRPGAYLRQQRETAGLSVEDLALRLGTHPELDLRRRIEWIRQIESGVDLISAGNAAEYLRAVRLDLRVLGHAVELIRNQRDTIIDTEAAVTAEHAA